MSRPVVELAPSARAGVASAISALVPIDARAFIAALELGYLAASADGLDAAERTLLASVLEQATKASIDQAAFTAHFADLDDTVATLGRRERLARTAADFESDAARSDAIQFAALIAMADGTLGEPELAVLTELGSCFAWPADRVRQLVDAAAAKVGAA